MKRYLARRLLLLVPVLMGVSIVVFMVLHLSPGDPAEIMLGSAATKEDLARLRLEMGLTEPLHVQYYKWVSRMARLDFGRSFAPDGRPVMAKIRERLPGIRQIAIDFAGLDPISTAKIEELIDELKHDYTVAIVTHNMQQAARVSDYTAYMYLGELIEFGDTDQIFVKPARKETEDYITGRFG